MSELGFALLGTGFMGGAHSRALHALRALPDTPRPRLVSICGRDRAVAERAREPLRLARDGRELAGAGE